MPDKPIPQKPYHQILKWIKKEIAQGQLDVKAMFQWVVLRNQWRIGRFLNAQFTPGEERSAHNARLVKRLSRDLKRAPAHFYGAVKFYRAYPKLPNKPPLSLSHYRVLSRLPNAFERHSFEQKALNRKIPWHDLSQLISDQKKKNTQKEQLSVIKEKGKAPVLKTVRGRLYHYRIISLGRWQTGSARLAVDMGFRHKRRLAYLDRHPDKFNAGAHVRSAASNGDYHLKWAKTNPDNLYTYKALVDQIPDADTYSLDIDCGFESYSYLKVRLRGIDAPEINTILGRKAKKYVEKVLRPCSFVVIKSYRTEKFGRFLVDLFYLLGEKDPHKVAAEGRFLNQELLDLGLAQLYRD